MNDETKSAIREAMLRGQSDWLTMSDQAPTPVEKVVGHAIAAAFGAEAAKYKTPDPERVGINADAYDKFASGDQS